MEDVPVPAPIQIPIVTQSDLLEATESFASLEDPRDRTQLIADALEEDDPDKLFELLREPYGPNTRLPSIYVPNGFCTRRPPIILLAAAYNALECARRLVKEGANVNLYDKKQRHPIHVAAYRGNVEMLHLLLDSGANVNKDDWDGWTPLHFCAMQGFVDGVATLCNAGAMIDAVTLQRETPLIIAIKHDQVACAKVLIDNRCTVDQPAVFHQGPLFFARSAAAVDLLVDAGCVQAEDSDGNWPILVAAATGLSEVARALLRRGGNIEVTDTHKQTPLHKAAAAGFDGTVSVLLELGAPLLAWDLNRELPEDIARKNKHYSVLEAIAAWRDSGGFDIPR